MNLSVKSVKFHDDMMQETPCFSASIYLDNKRVGQVRNDGCGGCHSYDWIDRATGREIEEWSLTQETEYDFEKLDDIIFKLCVKADELKDLKRWCKTQLVFRLKGMGAEEWKTLKPRVGKVWTIKNKRYLEKEYGDKIVRLANQEVHGDPTE